MSMPVIAVINSGSSSIKFALYQADDPSLAVVFQGQIADISNRSLFSVYAEQGQLIEQQAIGCHTHIACLQFLQAWLQEQQLSLQIIGHRVVHGGTHFAEPVLINDQRIEQLDELVPLAPLHQPHNLQAIKIIRQHQPQLKQLACFDTGFHHRMPEQAQRYALPERYYQQGIRVYGFHGLSYEYICDQLPLHLPADAQGRIIIAHLGNGASMCAVHQRKSVATTMGFTPLDGLMMGTRCGTIDPGVLLYLLEHEHTLEELETLLNYESGLLGVSNINSDMQTLLHSDNIAAKRAVDMFCYRAAREIGSLAAALNGLDALVFTGGIGEHAAPVRSAICDRLEWLGIILESESNLRNDAFIHCRQHSLPVMVIATDEQRMIARHCQRHLPASIPAVMI